MISVFEELRELHRIRKMKSGKRFLSNFLRHLLVLSASHILSPTLLKRRLDYTINSLLSDEIVREVNQSRMVLSFKDKGISRQLILYGRRETFTTTFLQDSGILSEGDVVLDIGANIGYYVLLESRLVGSSGWVYAVEPVSKNLKFLVRNLDLNGYQNVSLHHLAMGDVNDKGIINISEKSNWNTIRRVEGVKYVGIEEVDVVTVDSFLKGKRFPKLIRMDVEGYEYNVIKGMPETLRKGVNLLVEIHGKIMTEEEINEIFNILIENNYSTKFCVVDFVYNVNSFVNYLLDKIEAWKVPKVLDLDMEGLRQRTLTQKQSHVLFSKGGFDD